MSQFDALANAIDQWALGTIQAATQAVDELGDQVLTEAKELCPVSPTNPTIIGKRGKPIKNPLYTGTSSALRDSGIADDVVIEGDQIKKRVKFTDAKAAAVHERMYPRHGATLQAAFPQAHIPNLRGQAKFLSVAMLRARARAAAYIASRIAEVPRGA